MAANRGKEWESHFSSICESRGIDAVRFYDVVQGHKGVNNPADFVVCPDKSKKPYLIECKSTNSTNWGLYFDQYDRLIKLKKFQSFVIIWFVSYKEIWAMSLQAITRLRENGEKSFNPKTLRKKGRILDGVIQIPAEFARVKPQDAEIEKIWEIKTF